jgi:hypothetical protein
VRLLVVFIAALWGIAGVVALVRSRTRDRDARLTAAYILGYPVLAVGVFLSHPVPLWLGVPVVFGFIPWLMAGPHLWRLLADPGAARPDELIGIPRAYWLWGGLGALALGFLFD